MAKKKQQGSGVQSAQIEPARMPNSPRTRNKGVRRIRVADIAEHELNYREHPQEQQDAFTATVNEIGWYGYPDVYELPDGSLKLIDGHLRKASLLAAYGPDAEIEVNVTDMSEEDARKALLTHDPLAALATLNSATLESLIAEVDFDSMDLRRMVDDLQISSGEQSTDEGSGGDTDTSSEVEAMELRPHEHYDYIVILASDSSTWNSLCEKLSINRGRLFNGRRKTGFGICRAIRAERVLKLLQDNHPESKKAEGDTA